MNIGPHPYLELKYSTNSMKCFFHSGWSVLVRINRIQCLCVFDTIFRGFHAENGSHDVGKRKKKKILLFTVNERESVHPYQWCSEGQARQAVEGNFRISVEKFTMRTHWKIEELLVVLLFFTLPFLPSFLRISAIICFKGSEGKQTTDPCWSVRRFKMQRLKTLKKYGWVFLFSKGVKSS